MGLLRLNALALLLSLLLAGGASAAPLVTPYDVTVGSGIVYVLDSANGQILRLDGTGHVQQRISSSGYGAQQLSRPSALAYSNGRLYVADTGNNRVAVFSTKGSYLYSIGHFSRDGLPGGLYMPEAVAVGSSGLVYVADNQYMIHVFTSRGRFVSRWGHSRHDARRGAWLDLVDALAVDHRGRVYAADAIEHRIHVFSSRGAPLRRFGPRLGSWTLDRPSGLALGPGDSLFVADAFRHRADHGGNEKVLRLDGGRLVNQIGLRCTTCGPASGSNEPGYFYSPQGLAVSGGRLYVADSVNGRVQVFSLDGALLAVWQL